MSKAILSVSWLLPLFLMATSSIHAEVVLTENGRARCAIHVPESVMADNEKIPRSATHDEKTEETQRRRLRESIRDLATYLGRISGAEIPLLTAPPEDGAAPVPILIGRYAEDVFGPVETDASFEQGYRIVVGDQGVGILGQSEEAASYAIYTLLDQLGCRWFIPGELGESIPEIPAIRLSEQDVSSAPDTPYRSIWYGSDAYKRRNRLGGFNISAGHALDRHIPKEKLEANPKLNAMHDGKRDIDCGYLCWGNPETAEAVAEGIINRLDNKYVPSISLSPKDGVAFCECKEFCQPLDAGDWDPTMDTESLTDRYIVFCNRIAERVTKKYPDVQFGFLAYVQYTRPPVRETPHPNLVPDFAPITYCRAHAMTSDNCPSRPRLKPIVEGWLKVANRVAYYNYMYHLAETSVPYPMMSQMSADLDVVYGIDTPIFWQPETLSNFESVLPGMWYTIRKAWDNSVQPKEAFEELFSRFYGAAAEPMRRYWTTFDDAWMDTDAHAGCGWGHARRFTPEVMDAARAAMNDALAAAETPLEYRRVALFDESLRQFERFMQLRRDLAEGRLRGIDIRAAEWYGTQIGLAKRYSNNHAFGKVRFSPHVSIAASYFTSFYKKTYEDAGRLAGRRSGYLLLNTRPKPVREWRYQFVPDDRSKKGDGEKKEQKDGVQTGLDNGWHKPDFDAGEWTTTDSAIETWSDLGLLGKYGTMWYRATVNLPKKLPDNKKIYLWIAATDGAVRLHVNGQHIPYTTDAGPRTDAAKGYADPFSFDVTDAVKPGEPNHVAIAGTRLFINELGTGGLLGPVYFYREN